jgi:hypothetical protein
VVSENERVWQCSPVAIWLPRALAAVVLIVAVIASRTMDPGDLYQGSSLYRGLSVVLGALVALGILKQGGVLRWTIKIGEAGIIFNTGAKSNQLEYRDIVSIDYQWPFSSSRHWVPALVLEDRFGGKWRIPSFICDGSELLQELLRATGRSELSDWANARKIGASMGRGIGSIRVWYVLTFLILAWGVLFPFMGSS